MARKKKTPKYEQRLIVFLDFLGFSETVGETASDPQKLKRLINAIASVRDVKRPSDDKTSQRVTQFSDSLVVSYRIDETSAAFELVSEIALTVIDLAGRGYLVRGGMTVGPLLHTSKYLVGPAMLQAYDMEHCRAKDPRVIVDPAVIDLARKHHADNNTPDEEEGYVRGLMAEDTDGRLYLDYVSWNGVVRNAGGRDENYGEYLRDLSGILERGLANSSPGVLSKLLWLHERYISAIDLILSLPDDSDYRLQSPQNYEIATKLPRYEKEAEAARQVVENAKKTRSECSPSAPPV
jgi:hypothetical protein